MFKQLVKTVKSATAFAWTTDEQIKVLDEECMYLDTICSLMAEEAECWELALRAQGRGDKALAWRYRNEARNVQSKILDKLMQSGVR